MRNFSWTYFTMTGDVDAFLLYKEVDELGADQTSGSDGNRQEAKEWEDAE